MNVAFRFREIFVVVLSDLGEFEVIFKEEMEFRYIIAFPNIKHIPITSSHISYTVDAGTQCVIIAYLVP